MEISISFMHVLVAAIASYLVGWAWHGPLFGKKWMELSGFTPESMKSMPLSPAQAMALGFGFTILTAYVLAWLSLALEMVGTGIPGAIHLAFWPWLGFVVPTIAHKWLWEGKSFSLFTFNSAYSLVALFIMSLVLVFWI